MNSSTRMIAATLGASLCTLAAAEPWRFGVLTDTQGAGAHYPLVSTRLMEPVIDRLANHHDIEIMLSVGDLSDRGTVAEFDLWRQTAAPIYDAGIGVYAARGNHDVKTEETFEAVDPLFGPVELRETTIWDAEMTELSAPELVQGPGACYMFTHRDAFFIVIDLYGVAPSELIGWLQDVALPAAASSGTGHRVLFQHEPYFGRGRSGVLSADPGLELALLGAMSQAGIDLLLVGHDHQYSRSVALDPDGRVLLSHIITGSNSEKYYRLEEPVGPNEGCVAQINDRVGYSVVEIDGPAVTWTHYDSAAPDPANNEPWTPEWRIADRFTYSTSGDQYYVAPGAAYTGLTSTGPSGTVATLTGGVNATYTSMTTDPDPGTKPEPFELGELVSFSWQPEDGPVFGDVLVLDGLADNMGAQSDPYVLTMSYDGAAVTDEERLTVAYFDTDAQAWRPAASGNICGTGSPSSGVDTESDTVWARLDHNASGTRFGVAAFAPPCNAADLLAGDGALDMLDIDAFVDRFLAKDAAADLAEPYCTYDLSDIGAFVDAFNAGCEG